MGLTAREAIEQEAKTFTPDPHNARYADVVPFGITHIDDVFFMGVEPTISQTYGVQGQGGSRKTSLVLNILKNQFLSGMLPPGHKVYVDTLEAGMSIERYVMAWEQMIAEGIMIYEQWTDLKCIPIGMSPREYVWKLFNMPLPDKPTSVLIQGTSDVVNGQTVSTCCLTMDFVKAWYRGLITMTEKQLYAWRLAQEVVKDFPVEVFGVSEHPDGEVAAERSDDTVVLEESQKRWYAAAESGGTMQLVIDYLQEYIVPGKSDYYDKLLVLLPYISAFAKRTLSTVWIISQEAIGNDAEFKKSGRVLGGQGGNALRNTAQTLWRVNYNKDFDKYSMDLYSPVKCRRGNHPDLRLRISPTSGLIFGQSITVERK